GRSVLAVAQHAEDRVAWARRLDGGAPGTLQRFVDTHVFGAFDRPDGSTVFVTADGTRVCVGVACTEAHPAALVPVGERLALLELTTMRARTPGTGGRVARPAAAPKESKPAVHKGNGTAKGSAKKTKANAKISHAVPARRPSHPVVELF